MSQQSFPQSQHSLTFSKQPTTNPKADLQTKILEAIKIEFDGLQSKAAEKNHQDRSNVPNMDVVNSAMKLLGEIQTLIRTFLKRPGPAEFQHRHQALLLAKIILHQNISKPECKAFDKDIFKGFQLQKRCFPIKVNDHLMKIIQGNKDTIKGLIALMEKLKKSGWVTASW